MRTDKKIVYQQSGKRETQEKTPLDRATHSIGHWLLPQEPDMGIDFSTF
jgi:hypothetical protein